MAISRAQLMKQLVPGLNALFGLEYARYQEEHKDIFTTETSERSFEEETKVTGFGPAPVKPEGEATHYDEAQETYTARYTHETISIGFAVTEEAFEDNLYDSLSKRYTKALARSMAHTKQVKGASVLNNAFDPSFPGGDGVSLLNLQHPLVMGGAYNVNVSATAADLNETSLEAAATTIALWLDDRGLLIASKPRRLIVPAALVFTATRVLRSQYRPGTADNDINAIYTNGTIPEGWFVNHWLVDPKAWFIITDVPNGLKHFVRVPLQTHDDPDFDTGNLRYKARERYSFGWSDPLGAYGSPGGGG
jgi:hypothetical protein